MHLQRWQEMKQLSSDRMNMLNDTLCQMDKAVRTLGASHKNLHLGITCVNDTVQSSHTSLHDFITNFDHFTNSSFERLAHIFVTLNNSATSSTTFSKR